MYMRSVEQAYKLCRKTFVLSEPPIIKRNKIMSSDLARLTFPYIYQTIEVCRTIKRILCFMSVFSFRIILILILINYNLYRHTVAQLEFKSWELGVLQLSIM